MSAFGSVKKMLSGKNFPQNVLALRLVAEELLREIVLDANSHDELFDVVAKCAQESRTARLWFDCLIKPVFVMMLYIRAEREAN